MSRLPCPMIRIILPYIQKRVIICSADGQAVPSPPQPLRNPLCRYSARTADHPVDPVSSLDGDLALFELVKLRGRLVAGSEKLDRRGGHRHNPLPSFREPLTP